MTSKTGVYRLDYRNEKVTFEIKNPALQYLLRPLQVTSMYSLQGLQKVLGLKIVTNGKALQYLLIETTTSDIHVQP